MNTMIKRSLWSIVPVAVLAAAQIAQAGPLTANGITFTEQSGAISLTGLTGTGSFLDPFVLSETVSGEDVIVSVQGLSNFGNPTGSGHSDSFRLRKVITNGTDSNWTLYDNELQEILGIASTDGDGLSFAQGSTDQRPFIGNPLATVIEINAIRDYVNFSGGVVAPGGVLTVEYSISDNLENTGDIFYLRQRPNIDFEGGTVPDAGSTLMLLGLAMTAFGAVRRR